MGIEENIEALTRVKNAKLLESEELDLSSLGITTEDLEMLIPIIAETSATKLYLKDNPFQDLPESIKELKNLTLLNIDSSQLKTLPGSIGELTNLTELAVSGNNFETFPESTSKLTNLTKLKIRGDSFTTLPESISELKNLTELNISGNNLTALPESIDKLANLNHLHLSGNSFTSLPESIDKLINLNHLYVQGNNFASLPESIGHLKNLSYLHFGSDSYATLPESIGNLTNLKHLYISGNSFAALPQSIDNLKNLTELHVGGDRFTALPESIGNLKNLTELEVSSNTFEYLPESLRNLQNLTRLRVTGRSFATLPQSISDLTKLTHLKLLNSAIRKLPETLGDLRNLQEITLTNSPLSKETMTWLNYTFRGKVTYDMAAQNRTQSAKELLQPLYTDPSKQASAIKNLKNCNLEPVSITYGESQTLAKPAQAIIKEFLGKLQIKEQYEVEFYGPKLKSILNSILNKEKFSKEKRTYNLAQITTPIGDLTTPIKEWLTQEAVKHHLDQKGTLSKRNQTIIESEALRDAINRLEGYKSHEQIEHQSNGLLNAVYLDQAEAHPKNQVLKISGRRIRLPSFTAYPDFAFQQVQSNPQLIREFACMVCQTNDTNQPILHNGAYSLDNNKIKKIKDKYIAGFGCAAEQQNEKESPKPKLAKFAVPLNEKEKSQPKSPRQSAAKQANKARLTSRR